MCGYFFQFSKNLKKRDKLEIQSIRRDINRRGIDNFKYLQKKNFSMFFSRLSIIDLSKRSDQPFTDKENNYYLIFNGEIYNYLELKKQMINDGINFYTKSDTEVLFKLIINKGIQQTLKVIQGMFSFVFYDVKKKKIYGARDHFGQKPFYYYKSCKTVLISTNLRPIYKNINENHNIDLNINSVKQYLCCNGNGIIRKNKTFFNNIFTLPAGSYITIYKGKHSIKEYFKPISLFDKKRYLKLAKTSEREVLKILDKKIKNAVNRHLVGDTEIAVTCSGGLDSSLILNYVANKNKNVSVFTNTSKGIEKLSGIVPKIVSKNKVSKKKAHYIKQNKKEYFSYLSKLIYQNLTPPRWGGGPPMSILCENVRKKNIKVVLGGDGVDEYFYGYNRYNFPIHKKNKHGLNTILLLNDKRFDITSNIINDYYSDIIKSKKIILRKLKFIKNKRDRMITSNSFLDTEFFLQNCTLPHSDEYSMYNSVEMRNPFLDLELVGFCLNLPAKFKASKYLQFKNKYLIRKLAEKKYGKFINKEKEGTRNYSKYISNKIFWRFENFKILKKIKIEKNLHFKEIFKIIGLEILLRSVIHQNLNSIGELLSEKGLKEFKLFKYNFRSNN